jgi:hypothetical protein
MVRNDPLPKVLPIVPIISIFPLYSQCAQVDRTGLRRVGRYPPHFGLKSDLFTSVPDKLILKLFPDFSIAVPTNKLPSTGTRSSAIFYSISLTALIVLAIITSEKFVKSYLAFYDNLNYVNAIFVTDVIILLLVQHPVSQNPGASLIILHYFVSRES